MRKVLMLLVFFALCLAARAQKTDKGNFVTKVNAIPKGYNFWVYTPTEYEVDQHPLPLVIFLHGASLCGNNLQRVRRYGVLDAIDRGKIIPTLVVAPQNPGGAWSPQKINDLLEWTKAHYKVDTTRVYVLGMSLGGYGTMDFVDGNDKLLRYDWIQGGSHGLLARLFYLQKTYDWLFSHSLRDNPRTIDMHFEITRADINQTYQVLKRLPSWYDND